MSLFEGYWKQIIGAEAPAEQTPAEEALRIPEGYRECTGDDQCKRCQSGFMPLEEKHWFKAYNALDGERHDVLTAEAIRARQPKPFMPSVLKRVDPTEVDFKGAQEAQADEDEADYEKQRLRDLDPPPLEL